ncbi:asparaginase [Gordonia sp. TBRC 11910]|uniref:asparaginase n=1 Tax=Gordonia asplenii TaxID=2725283 RepID=A0A848L6N5_9ACTN|nr:asparaginase [Gordonia asplenii]NMO04191.1 asparaginase [Gordonia asplenii]
MPAVGGEPHIVVITTGGTVASRRGATGAIPALTGDDLLGRAGIGSAPVRIVDLMSLDSSAMCVDDQFRIVDAVTGALTDDAVLGVVVTHGTDTMEESAFLVDLYADDPRPVVFTGAQFTDDSPTADGPANLAGALACAADPDSRGRGVVVAMGGALLPARGLLKISTSEVPAFDVVHPELGRPTLPRTTRTVVPRVESLSLYPGVNPRIVDAAALDAAAIVLSATGSGNTHPDVTAAVARAVQRGVTVVVTSRVPYGEVTAVYGGGGGAVDLLDAGAILSTWLRAPQARMALLGLLSSGAGRGAVGEFFARSGPVHDNRRLHTAVR